ncbi:MAG: nickel-dependent hydrogenase large subunit, partial [Planctomycetaceae bacterium]|nr:nickel-dependent hydrogenase large subunit [Planctomycetaceae bacterium]
VAYQMSAVHALEAALGIVISPEVRRLRRLLYCGEWIESHGLHMHLLHAPDFFGVQSGLELAEKFPQEVRHGLQLKKHGNSLLEILGGRAIHPINVAVGGFHRAPRKEDLQKLLPDFEWGLTAAVEATRWVAGFDFPDFSPNYDMVALSHPDEYPMNEGCVASTTGPTVAVADYEKYYSEQHVSHSTALQSVKIPQQTCYHVGPLARVNLNRHLLSPTAQRVADDIGFDTPCNNPFKAIIARGLELIHAFEEAREILRDYRPFQPSKVAYNYVAAEGCAATEAPRGLIYHRYAVDATGGVTFAKIVPPTSQNQRQIETDLRSWIPQILQDDDQQMADDCERLIRTYDPCISCSTHFLKLRVTRKP